jgi:hypothetical protein
MKNSDHNPMYKAHAAPRCTARSKRSGSPCLAPAVRGWKVCRFHGAGGGAPRGAAHGNYRHGRYTCEAINQKKALILLARYSRLVAEAL